MKRKYFDSFLLMSAFLLPFYFVYSPRLNENRSDPFIKTLWRFTFAGFCFYGIAALTTLVIQKMLGA
ncbi:MAG: hypothetical protein K9J12_15355 [Melioribacteraceae bacterium]|nr:hypothetical protein [Melioribacteraceae bacterium]MCF8263087.1 hypothetical protein [Melioribacteraceae bacterium]MCF8413626.1 hypothetical protein [Melioribacteraceae bacterium]MCF8431361.1 hypothetical protein [Melioribacteraceae bacterium]